MQRPTPGSPASASPPQVNQLIVAGQWWRLVTPAFLHGSLIHLAVNCASLNNLAPVIEATAGKGRFAAIYLAAAVAGNVASFYGSSSPSLGASGAIFGVGGAMATYFYRNRRVLGDKRSEAVLRQLWQTLLINVAYGFLNPRIDNWCARCGRMGSWGRGGGSGCLFVVACGLWGSSGRWYGGWCGWW